VDSVIQKTYHVRSSEPTELCDRSNKRETGAAAGSLRIIVGIAQKTG